MCPHELLHSASLLVHPGLVASWQIDLSKSQPEFPDGHALDKRRRISITFGRVQLADASASRAKISQGALPACRKFPLYPARWTSDAHADASVCAKGITRSLAACPASMLDRICTTQQSAGAVFAWQDGIWVTPEGRRTNSRYIVRRGHLAGLATHHPTISLH